MNSPAFPPSRDTARAAENFACGCLVNSANPGKIRGAIAAALRTWRAIGDRERAQWFRRHAYFVGNPFAARVAS